MKTDPRPHLLLLSPFFHPEQISTGRYNAHLAENLVADGYRVTVICSHPLYPNWKPVESTDTIPGVQINRGGLTIRYSSQMLVRRITLELWFALYAFYWLRRLRGEVDVVVGVFPPSLFGALAAKLKITGAPWVGIVHDLQSVYAKSTTGGWLANLLKWPISKIERIGFRHCRSLVFLSDTMRLRAIEEYDLDKAQCTVIYPSYNVVEASEHAATAALFEPHLLHIVYAGALGYKQNPEPLFRLFSELVQRRPNAVCHIFSEGPVLTKLLSQKNLHPRLRCHPLVPDDALPTLYERSLVHVISEVPGAGQGSLPSKLANLLWMAVPIFCICDEGSELAHIVEDSNIGYVDSSFSVTHQTAALEEFIDRARTFDRNIQKRRLRPLLHDKFSVRRLSDLIESVRKEGKPIGPRGR